MGVFACAHSSSDDRALQAFPFLYFPLDDRIQLAPESAPELIPNTESESSRSDSELPPLLEATLARDVSERLRLRTELVLPILPESESVFGALQRANYYFGQTYHPESISEIIGV